MWKEYQQTDKVPVIAVRTKRKDTETAIFLARDLVMLEKRRPDSSDRYKGHVHAPRPSWRNLPLLD